MKRLYIIIFILMGYAGSVAFAQGQKNYIPPQGFIGKPAINFSLNVYPGSGKTATKRTMADYRGKWLVLEFWTRYCTVCIHGMPKLNSLAKQFREQANFLLIGMNDKKTGNGIESLYRRIASEEKLSLDVAFDTLSFKAYAITTTPKAIIISPEGMVTAYTYSTELTGESLAQLFASGKSSYPIVDQQFAEKKKRKLLFSSTGKSEHAHSSRLYQWQQGEPTAHLNDLDKATRKDSLVIHQVSLEKLYMLAHNGRASWGTRDSMFSSVYRKPVILASDSAKFNSSFARGKGLYSYEARLGKDSSSKRETMHMLQSDLEAWLPFRAHWEERQMPCLKLVRLEGYGNYPLSTAEKTELKGGLEGLDLKGAKVTDLIDFLSGKLIMVIQDGTGITHPIDLKLAANMLSLGSISQALRQSGLDLVPATRPMKVLVISDRPGP